MSTHPVFSLNSISKCLSELHIASYLSYWNNTHPHPIAGIYSILLSYVHHTIQTSWLFLVEKVIHYVTMKPYWIKTERVPNKQQTIKAPRKVGSDCRRNCRPVVWHAPGIAIGKTLDSPDVEHELRARRNGVEAVEYWMSEVLCISVARARITTGA